MSETLEGRCLCGATTFTATPGTEAGACHCEMCRRWSGGMFLSVACTDVTIAPGAPIGLYRGSPWGERVFCKECGASLIWRTQDGAHNHVSIQAFDDPSRFPPNIEVFIDRKPTSYALAGERHTMTEAEVFALFAPADDPAADDPAKDGASDKGGE